MQTVEVEERFKEMLAEAGFDMKHPNPRLAWDVWKSFAQEPVDCADDGVLFECGINALTGEELFAWGFVRQLWIEVDGEHEEEQFYWTLRCAPTVTLRKLRAYVWSYEFAALHDFFSAVEELEEFQSPLQSPQNWVCEVGQWKI